MTHEEFDDLSTSQKILYVQDLWDRIADETEESPLSEAHRAELEKRLASYRDNPTAGVPWSELRDRLLKKS